MPIYFKPFSTRMPLVLDSIGSDWHQEPISRPLGFPLYHWLQTEKGCGKIYIDHQEFLLNEGAGILIPPTVAHSYHGLSGSWSTLFATFEGSLSDEISKITGNSSYILVDSSNGHYYKNWVNRIIQLYTSQLLDSATQSVECYQFFLHLSSAYQTSKLQKHPLFIQYVEPIIKKIETGYSEALTVEDLSASVYVTPQYLTRLFHRFTNCSVYNYLTQYRITKAKELLIMDLHMDIKQIYHLVGYNDESQFIAIFRKHTGYTPRQFRKIYGM